MDFISQGGEYLVNLLNIYGPGISILFVVFVEAVGVCWFYGVDRFSSDIQLMIGIRPGLFWRLCWNWISPVFILVSFARDFFQAKSLNNLLLLPGYFYFLPGELRGPKDRWLRIPKVVNKCRLDPDCVIFNLHSWLHCLFYCKNTRNI